MFKVVFFSLFSVMAISSSFAATAQNTTANSQAITADQPHTVTLEGDLRRKLMSLHDNRRGLGPLHGSVSVENTTQVTH